MGFSLKELVRAIALTRSLPASLQPPLPAAFPSPLGCLVPSRSPSSHCAYGTMQLSDYSPGITSHFASRLIGSLILSPLRNPTSPPGVTLRSSVPCCPHTPWYDGWMSSAFASIVQARPCPIFGRPVRNSGGPFSLRPGTSPQALQTPLRSGRPAL